MGRIREVVTVAEILTEKVNKALLRYINLPSKQEKIFPVRLTAFEVDSIKHAVMQFDRHALVYLFGSRAQDDKRGGDIDILIFSNILTHRQKRLIRGQICDRIGEQKIDIIVAKDTTSPFVRIALDQGVLL